MNLISRNIYNTTVFGKFESTKGSVLVDKKFNMCGIHKPNRAVLKTLDFFSTFFYQLSSTKISNVFVCHFNVFNIFYYYFICIYCILQPGHYYFKNFGRSYNNFGYVLEHGTYKVSIETYEGYPYIPLGNYSLFFDVMRK